jgi:spore maturation protein CgeB
MKSSCIDKAFDFQRKMKEIHGFPGRTGVKLSYDEYFNLLRRSKFALSIAGSGFDTLRYWEIVASKVLLISEKPFIFIPHNFEHKKHALFCRSDFRDVPDLVKAYSRDDAAREQIVEAAYQHLLVFIPARNRRAILRNLPEKHLDILY